MLNAALSNVTNNYLSINQGYTSLPYNKLDTQIWTGFYFAMLVSLMIGSFGSGLSIVVSGERVTLVKHQQL
jgi:vacuolar-type H+-ATPase subunit I/STV1